MRYQQEELADWADSLTPSQDIDIYSVVHNVCKTVYFHVCGVWIEVVHIYADDFLMHHNSPDNRGKCVEKIAYDRSGPENGTAFVWIKE